MNRVQVAAASGALLLVLIGSGCAGVEAPPGAVRSADPATTVATGIVDCLAPDLGGMGDTSHADAQVAIRIPADFEPVVASVCDYEAIVEDEEGRWIGATLERRVGDFAALREALSAPDGVPEGDQSCDAMAESVPPLWLQDASGSTIRVDWPKDACNKIPQNARDALAQLAVEESTFYPVRLIETRAALDAGCSTTWGFPAGKFASPSHSAEPKDPTWLAALDSSDSMLVCRYETDEAAETGRFVSAKTLDQAQSTAFSDAVASAAAAPLCNDLVGAFVVVWPRNGVNGSSFTVELDGCQRLMSHDVVPYTAPAGVLALLELS